MKYTFIIILLFSAWSCQHASQPAKEVAAADTLKYPQEKHLKNLRQLTFGGDNAEAYFSFDSQRITFQSNNPAWQLECDQIFTAELATCDMKNGPPQRISTGLGRTTCSYFMPGDTTILFASTHAGNAECPLVPPPRADHKYIWPIYSDYDIYISDLKGNIIDTLTHEPGYDAEATVSPNGDRIVFTSLRSGDLELYTMNMDGSDVKQITNELGYDGGAFFSQDGSMLVFRASRPKTDEDVKVYKELLAQGEVMPTNMEIFVCNADGSNLRQVTHLGKANWAPYFHPSMKKIIFSSNHAAPKGYQFNLYMINLDGTGLEQITYDGVFDAFPMFSFDGKKLIFSSNRNNGGTHNTNLFIGDWVE
jgi:Tol biopolymer transport system component